MAHALEEKGHPAQTQAEEGAASVEILVEELRSAVHRLSRVKVPAGMEAFQEDLLAMYGGVVSAVEAALSALHPRAAENESAHGGEAGQEHGGEVEGPQEAEGAHGEESQPVHGGEGGDTGDSHTGAGH